MWIFCKYGFFSAVENINDKKTVLVRARFKGDLEKLLDRFEWDDYSIKVTHTPGADYAYRTTMPKEVWANILTVIANEIDYPNFKDSVHEGGNSVRDRAYMGCWWQLRQGQINQ